MPYKCANIYVFIHTMFCRICSRKLYYKMLVQVQYIYIHMSIKIGILYNHVAPWFCTVKWDIDSLFRLILIAITLKIADFR